MHHRFPLAWIVPAAPPVPLLVTASTIKLEMARFQNDEGDSDLLVTYEVHGYVGEDDSDLLRSLLSQFRTPRTEGGSHA